MFSFYHLFLQQQYFIIYFLKLYIQIQKTHSVKKPKFHKFLSRVIKQKMSKIIPNKNLSSLNPQPMIKKVKRSDFEKISFFAKQFCLPKQIKLIQYATNKDNRDSRQNIQIVDRINPFDTNPIYRDITPIDFSSHPDPGDGLISLLKNLNIKVAICITVYSEDKTMLKKTLQGIRKNYQTFYQKAGIYSHQIVIIIIFDGIQYLNNNKQSDKNMFNLFRQYDLINGFRKKQYLLAKQKQEIYEIQHENIDDSIIDDIQNFADQIMFTQQQYQTLQSMLLQNEYNRYKSMSQLLQFAQDIENKKLHNMSIQSLPKTIKQAFIIKARQYLQDNGIQDITQNNKQLEDYIVQNLPQQKIDILKIDALKDAVILAKDYLKSRQNTAIMYQMALSLQLQKQKQKQKNGNYEKDAKMNIFTIVKYSNRGKLSSHLWFFEGFCNMINPSVCVLLDCGLQPQKDSIFKVWAHIQTYKHTCGGVCGYMKLRIQSPYDQSGNRPQAEAQSYLTKFTNIFVDIQKAQIFQYHFSHLLDKPFQSLTGYIHVLPGAFSGYNWDALKSEKFKVMRSDGQVFEKNIQKRTKQQILKKYLKTVIYNEILDNIEQANMYLAQDRILCLEIYTKKKNQFNLQYLPDSYAYVDPITTLPKLLSQRKRWINGSWFALNYVLKNKDRVSQSSHNCWDKFWFYFNMFHAQIMKYVSYLSMAFFFVTLHLMVLEFSQTTLKLYFMQSYNISQSQLVNAKIFTTFFSIRSVIDSATRIFDFIYLCCLGIVVYRSLTLRRQDNTAKKSFNTISTWFGFFGIFTTALIFINFYQAIFSGNSDIVNIRGLNGVFTQQTFIYLLIAIVSVHTIIVLTALSFKTYWQILTSVLSYFFYAPSYINLFFIYAFCRIDDLSWGTKGLDTETKIKQISIRKKFVDQKISFSIQWLSINIIVSVILIGLANNYDIQNYIIWIFSAYFAIVLLIKLIFVIIYLLQYYIIKRIKVILMYNKNKQKYIKQCINVKQMLRKFIDKMKQQDIDQHVQQINQQLIKKRIYNQAWQNQRDRLIQERQSQIIHKNNNNYNQHNNNGFKKIKDNENYNQKDSERQSQNQKYNMKKNSIRQRVSEQLYQQDKQSRKGSQNQLNENNQKKKIKKIRKVKKNNQSNQLIPQNNNNSTAEFKPVRLSFNDLKRISSIKTNNANHNGRNRYSPPH